MTENASRKKIPSLRMDAGAANMGASWNALGGSAGLREDLLKIFSFTVIDRTADRLCLDGVCTYFPTGRTYGGQLMSQAIAAAGLSVPEGRLPHSVHCYYITPGRLDEHIRLDVDVLRDGGSFSQRAVTILQDGNTLLRAMLSFQKAGQQGIDYSNPALANLPDPESLESSFEQMRPYENESVFARYYSRVSAFDIRHIGAPALVSFDNADTAGSGTSESRQMAWARLVETDADPGDQILQRALLAYGCDQIMPEPAMRRSGISFTTPGLAVATLDSSLWFYRDVDATRWHLYVQDSPVAGNGRAFCRGRIYQDSALCAEIAQDVLIRLPRK